MTKRNSPEFMHNRRIVLENEPICHWCHKAPSTEADHLIEVDRGGTDDLENLCGSCKKCNSIRGNRYLNAKRTAQQQSRAEHLQTQKNPKKTEKPKNTETFLKNEKKMTDRKSVV
jgi:5-methylcytosine-specific restriction endonuclease McrA